MYRLLLTSCLSLAFAMTTACGKDDDASKQAPKDQPATDTPSTNAPEVAPEPDDRPDEPEVAPPDEPALTKKKLGELDTFAWMDIVKAAGWGNASSGGMTMGAWSQNTITAKKDGKTAKITIVGPSGEAEDPASSVKAQPPAEQLKALQEKGAAELLKDDFLVGVVIEGDPEGAAALLAHIKEWVIVE